MKLKVNKIVKETDDTVSIYLKNKWFFNKVKYKAGQFLTLNFNIDGKKEKRAYSFSSNPYTDKELRITVKRVEKGIVSNYIYNNIEKIKEIVVDNVSGNFYVEPSGKLCRMLVLFGAGSGITPLLSIIKSILHVESASKVLLFYANKNETSIIFKKEIDTLLEQYGDRLEVVHILEEGAIEGSHSGFIREEIVTEKFQNLGLTYSLCEYYMCGPAAYMDEAKGILQNQGVEKNKIHSEAFSLPAEKSTTNVESNLIIRKADRTFTLLNKPGDTILQASTSQNIEIPYSCRSGMCSSCKAKCTEGSVKMLEGHFLSQKEVDEGYILTCISYPTTEKVVISLEK